MAKINPVARTIILCVIVFVSLAWVFTIRTDPAEYDLATNQIIMTKEDSDKSW